jgi:hypothetical protein
MDIAQAMVTRLVLVVRRQEIMNGSPPEVRQNSHGLRRLAAPAAMRKVTGQAFSGGDMEPMALATNVKTSFIAIQGIARGQSLFYLTHNRSQPCGCSPDDVL